MISSATRTRGAWPGARVWRIKLQEKHPLNPPEEAAERKPSAAARKDTDQAEAGWKGRHRLKGSEGRTVPGY